MHFICLHRKNCDQYITTHLTNKTRILISKVYDQLPPPKSLESVIKAGDVDVVFNSITPNIFSLVEYGVNS